MGHASWLLAAAEEADIDVPPFSHDIREVRSCASDGNGDADACESKETLLAEGDRTRPLESGDGVDRCFALPKMRPPPKVLGAMIQPSMSYRGRASTAGPPEITKLSSYKKPQSDCFGS